MIHRPADTRLLSNRLQQEKDYSEQLSQFIQPFNAYLAWPSLAAYVAPSPPPGSHVVKSVAGSLAAIDDALEQYLLVMDGWRETIVSFNDARGNIMRDRESLCVCAPFFVFLSFFFFVSHIRFFPE